MLKTFPESFFNATSMSRRKATGIVPVALWVFPASYTAAEGAEKQKQAFLHQYAYKITAKPATQIWPNSFSYIFFD